MNIIILHIYYLCADHKHIYYLFDYDFCTKKNYNIILLLHIMIIRILLLFIIRHYYYCIDPNFKSIKFQLGKVGVKVL